MNGKKSIQILAEDVGDSFKQIQRYIRLTELIEPLRVLVDGLSEDGKKIALNPAVELSFLNKEQQQDVYKFIQELDATPSYAQTMRMKELAKSNRLDEWAKHRSERKESR